MDEKAQELLKAVTEKTNSELILFFVVVLIILVLVLLPMYKMVTNDRKVRLAQEGTRQDKYIEREKEIIHVIAANSEVIAGLKTTLDISNTAHSEALSRVHSRIDGLAATTGDLATTLTKAVATISEIVNRQIENCRDIKEVLRIVDNGAGKVTGKADNNGNTYKIG